MSANNSLLTDIPIQNRSEDLFEYEKFTQRFVACLKEFRSQDGLVVALNGEWGSGKTSVINLIKADLIKDNSIKVVSYSYWWYEGRKEVITAFLFGLLDAIHAVGYSEKAVSEILDFIQPLASIVDHITGSQIPSDALKIAHNIFNPVSLEKRFSDIKDFLKSQEKQIVIFIDDLDRMNPDDSVEVYKLLKTIGRLPNVTFVIVYDKAQANRTILQKYPSEGKNFLEKVVQVSFDMPEPSSERLFKVFQKELSGTFPEHINHLDLNFFWDKYLRDFIKTPRNLGRLLANIEFNAKPIISDIYLPDFILLEVLRLQFPSIYLEISRNKRVICTDNPLQVTYAKKEEIDSQFLEVLLNECGTRHRTSLQRLLTELLSPNISIREAKILRRICSNDYFETYFDLNVSDDVISEYELKRLISTIEDGNDFISSFGGTDENGSFKDKKHFAVFLKELSLRPDLVTNKNKAEELLETLVTFVDKGYDTDRLLRSDDLINVYELYIYVWEVLGSKFFNDVDYESVILKLKNQFSVNLLAQWLNNFRKPHRVLDEMQSRVYKVLEQAFHQKIQSLLIEHSILHLGNRLGFCLSVYSKNFKDDSVLKESLNFMLSNSLCVDKLARCFTSIAINADGTEIFYAHDEEITRYFDALRFYTATHIAASESAHENAKRFMSVSKFRIDSSGRLMRAFG